jgi:hypothetical protein
MFLHLSIACAAGQLTNDVIDKRFGVSKQHQRLAEIVKRIVDTGETWAHAAFDDRSALATEKSFGTQSRLCAELDRRCCLEITKAMKTAAIANLDTALRLMKTELSSSLSPLATRNKTGRERSAMKAQ